MYKIFKREGIQVGIAQTGSGWKVSTCFVKSGRVYTYVSKNTKTLANANKEFTRQKRRLIGSNSRRKK